MRGLTPTMPRAGAITWMLLLCALLGLAAVAPGTTLAMPVGEDAVVDPTAKDLPGISEIGCGYDVSGQYASPRAVKLPLFDLYKDGPKAVRIDLDGVTAHRVPKAVTFHPVHATEYSFSSGSDSAELSKSLAAKVGLESSFGAFTSSFSTDFDSSSVSSRAFTFSRVQYNVNLYTLQLGTTDDLKAILTESARKSINTMNSTALFDAYGTHYVSSMVMGGRSVVASATSKYKYDSKRSLEAVAKAAAKFTIGVDALASSASGSGETKLVDDAKNFLESSKTTITTKGGDGQFGSELPAKFQDWSKSVQKFPMFVDFMDRQSLPGIWTLADTPERAQELERDARKYLEAAAKLVPQHEGPVLEGKWIPLVPAGSSVGSGTQGDDLHVYKPQFGTEDDDWFYLGQTGMTNAAEHHTTKGLAVRELVAGVLGSVGGWERIWTSSGNVRAIDVAYHFPIYGAIMQLAGNGPSRYSLWHPTPASAINYAAMGSYFRGPAADDAAPSQDEAAKLKVLHRDFVEPATPAERVWANAGPLGGQYGSVWRVRQSAAHVSWANVVGSDAYNWESVPEHRLLAIKTSAITFGGDEGGAPENLVMPNASSGKARSDVAMPTIVSKKVAPGATKAVFSVYRFEE